MEKPYAFPLPQKAGDVEIYKAHGRVLTVLRTKNRSWFMTVDNVRDHARWADYVDQAREDIEHFLQMGALPRGKAGTF